MLHSQDTLRSSGQEVIESILDNASDEQDVQNFGDELEYFREHPVSIVKPTYSELIKLPFVSPLLAESIILFSDTVEINSVEQLKSVSLMTPVLYTKLLPFIVIGQKDNSPLNFNFLPSRVNSRSRLERRLQITDGFKNNKFNGDANGTYQRIKIGNKNVEIAGLLEKDAGEAYGDGFIVGYLSIKDISVFKNLIIGNYNISAAQGLVLAKNISTSKGSDAVGQIRKRGSTISPSVSADEYRYFSGSAIQLKYQNTMLTSFYSERKLPASIDSNGVASSFYTSGIYRTESDINRRNTLTEKVVGGKIDFSFDPSKTISLNLMNVEYKNYLKPTLFDLKGKRSISAGSLSWEIPVVGVLTFGEAASNDGNRFSKALGLIFPLTKSFAVSYHYRAYTKGYTSPFARPFGERDNVGDGELGNYLGVEIKNENTDFNSYIDQYTLPSVTNGFDIIGRDLMVYIQQSISRQFDFTFQIRNKIKSQIEIRFADDERHQTNYRIAYKFKVTSKFSLSQRFEIVKVSYNPSQYSEDGFLTFVEGIYRNPKKGISLKARCILFDTHSYDSRLYQYESDVAGNFSNPPIYGKGIRWYAVAGYEFFENFLLSFKYSETKKLDEVVLGSGDDQIQGNLDNQIALQLDFEF
ncbi:MAG: hypothetical protein Q8L88_14465 [Bacteroidota bacterium]|nr:hypothetical protein [Bacteroidota bacterium]